MNTKRNFNRTCKEKDAKIRELESRVKNLEKVVFQILQSYPVPNQAPAPGVFGTRASATPTTYNITRAPGTNIASNAPVLTGNDLDFLDFGNPGTAHDEPVSPDPAIHTSDFTSTSSTSGALRQTNITGWEDFLNLDVSGTETAHDDPGLQGDAGYPADFNDTNTIFGMLASVNNEIPEDLLEQMRAAS